MLNGLIAQLGIQVGEPDGVVCLGTIGILLEAAPPVSSTPQSKQVGESHRGPRPATNPNARPGQSIAGLLTKSLRFSLRFQFRQTRNCRKSLLSRRLGESGSNPVSPNDRFRRFPALSMPCHNLLRPKDFECLAQSPLSLPFRSFRRRVKEMDRQQSSLKIRN